MAQAEIAVDGRRARRERGRIAVIDAVIDLLLRDGTPPAANDVAACAGVSPATLFRYFETVDELQLAATNRFFERNAGLFDIPSIGEGPLDGRADRYAAARVALYGQIAPVARLGRARSADSPHFAETLHTVRCGMADQIRAHFAPELDDLTPAAREDAVSLFATVTSFESWDQLTQDFGRTPAQIRRTWRRAIEDACT